VADVMKSAGRDGPSQIGVAAAMRARDVARPTDAQLAEAEAAEIEVEPASGERYRAPSSDRGGSAPDAS
jgi:hypothetical protein